MMICAIILAGGQGTRCNTNGLPKQYQSMGGMVILRRTVESFLRHPLVGACCVVYRQGDEVHVREACKGLQVTFCVGGGTRQASVCQALEHVSTLEPKHVLIHDGVRPFVSQALIGAVCAALQQCDAVVPMLSAQDTVYFQEKCLPRGEVQLAQTPQGFLYAPFRRLHMQRAAGSFTDDISLVAGSMPIASIPGEKANFKVTDDYDLQLAQQVAAVPAVLRVGIGFDMHAFCPGDHIMLGGVRIAHTRGLLGHSDADVVIHSVVDAILGALNQSDIGQLFPSQEARWAGVSSRLFLETARDLLMKSSARIQFLDITIIAQEPPLALHYGSMALSLASTLQLCPKTISVKATTTDHLGCVGRREGVAALAVATVVLESF